MNARRCRQMAVLSTLCCVLTAAVCSGAFASDFKPAQMSFQNVIKNSTKVKAWVEEIKRIQTEGVAKSNTLASEVGKLEQQLAKAQENAEEKEKIAAEIQKKREELRSEQETSRVKVSFKQQSMQSVIRSQVQEVVDKIAKDNGYTMVVSIEAIYYAKDVPDITDRVTQALDALPVPEQQLK
jgi:Skp family chaperone for outer membrane proteins